MFIIIIVLFKFFMISFSTFSILLVVVLYVIKDILQTAHLPYPKPPKMSESCLSPSWPKFLLLFCSLTGEVWQNHTKEYHLLLIVLKGQSTAVPALIHSAVTQRSCWADPCIHSYNCQSSWPVPPLLKALCVHKPQVPVPIRTLQHLLAVSH